MRRNRLEVSETVRQKAEQVAREVVAKTRRNVAQAPAPVPTELSLPVALQVEAGQRAAYVQAEVAGLTTAQLADRLEQALNGSDAVGAFLSSRRSGGVAWWLNTRPR
jgi:hypothetical protein